MILADCLLKAINSILAAVIVLMILLGFTVSAIGGEGKPTSCFKWSYNHLDGFVAERGDAGKGFADDKQTGSYQDKRHYRIKGRLVFYRHLAFSQLGSSARHKSYDQTLQ